MKCLVLVFAVVVCIGHVRGGLGELSQQNKDYILEKHNEARINEGASNMYELTWSAELESEMQTKVDKCTWGHTSSPTWGENLGQLTFASDHSFNVYPALSKIDILVVTGMPGFNSWLTEKTFVLNHDFTCIHNPVNGKKCGHYSQMVWAATTKLGCAAKSCLTFDMNGIATSYVWYLACAYRKAGNVNGVKPFEIGQACTACKANDGCSQDLCVAS